MARFRAASPSRPRRPMDWEYISANAANQSSGLKVATQVVTSTELNAEYTDPTLMGALLICQAITQSVSLGGAIGFGLIAWDDFNNTPPASTEAPGPITNGNLDWILRQVFPIASGLGSSVVISDVLDMHSRSRARRRLGSSRTVLLVVEGTGANFNWSADVRVLIKE